jgi:hypothetical protein
MTTLMAEKHVLKCVDIFKSLFYDVFRNVRVEILLLRFSNNYTFV